MCRSVRCVMSLGWARQRIQGLLRDDRLADPSGVIAPSRRSGEPSLRQDLAQSLSTRARPAFVQRGDAQDYRTRLIACPSYLGASSIARARSLPRRWKFSTLLLDVPELQEQRDAHADERVAPRHRGEELPGVHVGQELVVALLDCLGDLLLLVQRAGGDETPAQLLDRFLTRPDPPMPSVSHGDDRKGGGRA